MKVHSEALLEFEILDIVRKRGAAMSEDAVRQTRSQKRAMERDALPGDVDSKKAKLERGELARAEAGAVDGLRVSSIVKATIKVEVQSGDEPVDMSTSKSDMKERRPPSPDDVIVLSDNEPSSPQMNGLNHCSKELDTELLMKSSPAERERIIKQLKEELRLEEAKLVLLKKLRQSQLQKEAPVQKASCIRVVCGEGRFRHSAQLSTLTFLVSPLFQPVGSSGSVATPPPLVRGSMATAKGPLQVSSGRSSGTVIPPPLVRGGQQVSSKLGSQNAQIVMPPLVRGAQIHSLRQQQQQQHSASGPPPLLLAPRATVPNVQVQGQRIIQQGLIRVANVPNTSVLVNIPQASPTNLKGSSVTSQAGLGNSVSTVNANDSPASRQAAAKLALRKQLEKTLLEIPPPKPPAPDLNFLPSAANNEFIYLVGLEEVVQNLLDTLGKGKQLATATTGAVPKDPFICTQCKTDFTSRWRQEKSGAIMCENCMTTNQKKSLKAEHTSRLKAAFVKALQQEQEIEQRMASSPVSKTLSSATKTEQQVLVSQQMKQARVSSVQQQHSRGAPIGQHISAIKQSSGPLSRSVHAVGARGVPPSFTSSAQLQSAVTAAALVSRPGKLAAPAGGKAKSSCNPVASAWVKQSTVNPGVTMAYVNPSLSVHKTSSTVDRQREYLLDMLPSRSISQTANTWK
ncbi:transcriptional repressor p66-alpha-like [Scleropages formosus]|uniref:Transcriptional repressor p66-alpha-like n=2 Tax=Scleropages formosus TaxID=113540 RepID=A0A0P7WVA1_SCLFO|nr:transcriptional repressor p66-alpha-like [Scleropages formosus]